VGPADVLLESTGSTPSEQRFTGTVVKSGSYTLRASVAGRSIAGFPRNLQVVAAHTAGRRNHSSRTAYSYCTFTH
jgi:filamin